MRRWLLAAGLAVAVAACGTSGTAGRHASPTPTRAAAETPPPGLPTPGSASPSGPPTPGPASPKPAQPAPSVPAVPLPAAAPPAPAKATAVDLTFTGSIAGRVRSATAADPCGKGTFGLDAQLDLSLSGQASLLSIAIFDYHGPGSYAIPPGSASVRVGPADSGHVTRAVE